MGARTAEARSTTVEPSDGALVRRHLAGDDQAFVDIYDRFHQRLVLYCRQRVPDMGMAEDLAQDAFVRALEALDRFDLSRPLWPWLKTIARRLAIDQARSPDLEVMSSDVDEVIVIPPPMHEERIDLERTLDNVNDRHALVLRLWYVEDWSAEDVCDLLGLSRNALDQLLHRARARLRQEYERVSSGARAAFAPVAAAAGWASDLRARVRLAVHQSTLLGGAMPFEGARQAFAAALVGLVAVGSGPAPGPAVGPAAAGTGSPAPASYALAAADHHDGHNHTGDRVTAAVHRSSDEAPRASERKLAASSDTLVRDGEGDLEATIVRGRDHSGESHITIELTGDPDADDEAEVSVTADLRCTTNDATQATCDTVREVRRSVPSGEEAGETIVALAAS